MNTIDSWLPAATERLRRAGIDSARLDCLLLLEDSLERDRAWILAHAEEPLTARQLRQLEHDIDQRRQHIPLAYIRGHSQFYGHDFIVNQSVLTPRPESEDIINLLVAIPGLTGREVIVDVGTGSGALAVSAKLALPNATVYATDIDPACLVVAKQNAQALGTDIQTIQADLTAASDSRAALPAADIILANLPYVPTTHHINQAAQHEPAIAIFGGQDGLDPYRRLFDQLAAAASGAAARRPGHIITEALPASHDGLTTLAKTHGYQLTASAGFVQQFSI